MTHCILDIEKANFGNFNEIVVEDEIDPTYLINKQQKVLKISGISLDYKNNP